MSPLPFVVQPGSLIPLSGLEWGIREIMISVAGPAAEQISSARSTVDGIVAVHEAGHVVMQFLLGARLEGASIVPWPGHSLGRASARRRGPIELETPSRSDAEVSSDYARLAGVELSRVETAALELLAEYWPLVRALAARLVERKVISGRRTRQILFRGLRKDVRRARALAQADRRRQQETERQFRAAFACRRSCQAEAAAA
jgi:hypothetical protein